MQVRATTTGDSLWKAESVTHDHLLAVINTEIQRFSGRDCVSILDAGCGNGHLMAHLAHNLAVLHPSMDFRIYGFEVYDHGMLLKSSLCEETMAFLGSACPETDWRGRVRGIAEIEPWPFPDETFDIVISNQVLEHVHEPLQFFRELGRVLKPGGFSANLFPLKHYILEGHLFLPWVHRIENHDLLRAYIRLLSRLGLGKFRGDGATLAQFSEQHADYMRFLTNYLTYREALQLAKKARLRCSFRYTPGLYRQKLRLLVGKRPAYKYSTDRSPLFDALSVFILRYIQGVTLYLENSMSYRPGTNVPSLEHRDTRWDEGSTCTRY